MYLVQSHSVVLLIKHAETIENAAGIHQGRKIGGTLSQAGHEQAKRLAHFLSTQAITKIFASPASRAIDTANYIAAHHPGLSVDSSELIGPKNSGEYGGRPRECIVEDAKKLGIPVHLIRPLGGESSVDVQLRVCRFFTELLDLHHKDLRFLAVTHGGVIATLLLHIFKRPFEHYLKYVPDPGSITIIRKSSDRLEVPLFNDRGYLPLLE